MRTQILQAGVALLCLIYSNAHADEFNSANYNVDVSCPNEISYKEFHVENQSFLDNAYLLSEMSLLPQTTESQIKTALSEWGFQSYHTIRRKKMKPKAIIASKEDYVVLAFRGTDNVKEAIADFLFLTVEVDNPAFKGKVHKGFWELYSGMREEIFRELEKFGGKNKKIFLAGHSMGSAMAIYTAHELSFLGYEIGGLYEYGSPRYGDRTLSNNFREIEFPKFNFAEPHDIVPQIPPTVNSLGSFVRLAEHINPNLKAVTESVLKETNFGYHSVDEYFLVENQSIETYSREEQKKLEVDYWSTLENELLSLPKKRWPGHIEKERVLTPQKIMFVS